MRKFLFVYFVAALLIGAIAYSVMTYALQRN